MNGSHLGFLPLYITSPVPRGYPDKGVPPEHRRYPDRGNDADDLSDALENIYGYEVSASSIDQRFGPLGIGTELYVDSLHPGSQTRLKWLGFLVSLNLLLVWHRQRARWDPGPPLVAGARDPQQNLRLKRFLVGTPAGRRRLFLLLTLSTVLVPLGREILGSVFFSSEWNFWYVIDIPPAQFISHVNLLYSL